MTRHKPLRLRRRLTILALSSAVLAATWGLAQWPRALEQGYGRYVGFPITRALSTATSVIPLSLAELALLGVAIYLVAPPFVAAWQIVRRQRAIGNALAAGTLRVITASAVVFVAFYAAWGWTYARAPLASRLGWPPIETPADAADDRRQTEEIAALSQQLVEATNRSYREFAGSDDLGRPTERPVAEPALEAAFVRVQQRLGLEPQFGAARGEAKPLVASVILNHLRLTGFYFPWTGEANYNRLVPSSTRAHTVAHEKSHQRGIAREDEAGFVGYLACALSDDAYTRYSGYLFAHQQLLGELVRRDRGRAREIAALRIQGVQRDLEAIRAFWQQYEGPASRVSETVNNAYIRSQGDRRGVAAYAASRSLIVLFARNNGGIATGK